MITSGPLFSVRPVFIGWITLVIQLPLQLFMTIWAGGFFGSMTQFVLPGTKLSFIFFGALAFFGIPAIAYFGKKLNYGRSEYRFFPDHLEFEEGFFSINKKVIRYRDVREVTLHKGIFQRIYGLGTIYLATLATGSGYGQSGFNWFGFGALGFGNVSASGVNVRDVQQPDAIFEKIRQIVDTANK